MTAEDINRTLNEALLAERASDYSETEKLASVVLSARPTEKQRAEALRLKGNVAWRHADYSQAQELYSVAREILEKLGDQRAMAQVFAGFGNVYASLAQYTTALDYYYRARSIVEELEDTSGIANLTNSIGNVLTNQSKYIDALECHQKALSLYEQISEAHGKARVLLNIGNVYFRVSEQSKALEYYHRSLTLYTELGDKISASDAIFNIGSVYGFLGEHAKTLEYYSQALSVNEELGRKSQLAFVNSSIGKVLQRMTDYTQALEFQSKALGVYEEIGDKLGMAAVNNSIAVVFSEQALYPQAQKYFNRALSLYEELSMREGIALVRGNLGKWHADPKNPERDVVKAESLLLEALAVNEEIGVKFLQSEGHKDLAEMYEGLEEWKKSLEHFKKHTELQALTSADEAKKKADRLEFERQEADRENRRAMAKAAADAELRGTQSLLYRVLPQSIATRLIRGDSVADYYERVSILFADIVGFTPISAQMPAHVVVKFLNHVFGTFDAIMKEHGCEKIKTIGDGYMAVAGAPVECADHAERIAAAALAMQRDILLPDDIREHIEEGTVFNIRIGIHVGSAVGGIIGDERFVFDVYSDAVNMAARMEQSSEPGKIHVSTDFAMHLQNRINQTGGESPFKLVRRGQVEIKGKGAVKTYWLEQV